MRSRIIAIVSLIIGMLLGNIATVFTYAGSTNGSLRLPLEFNSRQFHGTLYVDESQGSTELVFRALSTNPLSPQVTRLGPACPGTSEFIAAQFNGDPSNWSGGYPRYGYGLLFESPTPTQLNINFGSFWHVADGEIFDLDKPPDAHAGNPQILTKRGVWQCFPPRQITTSTPIVSATPPTSIAAATRQRRIN